MLYQIVKLQGHQFTKWNISGYAILGGVCFGSLCEQLNSGSSSAC